MFDFERYINCSECPKEKSKDNIYLSNFKNLSSKGKIEFKNFFNKIQKDSGIKKYNFINKSK